MVVLATIGGTATTATAATPTPLAASACVGTIQITSLTFTDSTPVQGGQIAHLTLVAQNCTSQSQSAKVMWTGRFTIPPSPNIAPGCAAIDPLVPPLNFAPSAQATATMSYLIFSGCTATDLAITATISSGTGSTVFAQQTAHLTIRPGPGPCRVSYVRQSEWAGGFVAMITITNTATTPINGWSLSFAFPGDQTIGNRWNAVITQTGQAVTANNTRDNATINAGAGTSFGFQGTWQASDASPTAFTLNGAVCATG